MWGGGDVIAGGLLQMIGSIGISCRGFLVKRDEKCRGKPDRMIGSVRPNDRCLLVEDVVTIATNALDAISQVEAIGARVVSVIAAIDRLHGSWKTAFDNRGIHFTSLVTAKDLGIIDD